jgi:hypothetical protein
MITKPMIGEIPASNSATNQEMRSVEQTEQNCHDERRRIAYVSLPFHS